MLVELVRSFSFDSFGVFFFLSYFPNLCTMTELDMIIKHLACDACEQFSPEHENDERKQNALSSSGSSRVSMSIAWAYQHQPHFLNVTYMTDELKTLSHSIAMCVCMVWKPSDPSSTTTKIAISQQTFETTTKTKYERLTVQLTHNPTKV